MKKLMAVFVFVLFVVTGFLFPIFWRYYLFYFNLRQEDAIVSGIFSFFLLVVFFALTGALIVDAFFENKK